jgi:hypothetical protein
MAGRQRFSGGPDGTAGGRDAPPEDGGGGPARGRIAPARLDVVTRLAPARVDVAVRP